MIAPTEPAPQTPLLGYPTSQKRQTELERATQFKTEETAERERRWVVSPRRRNESLSTSTTLSISTFLSTSTPSPSPTGRTIIYDSALCTERRREGEKDSGESGMLTGRVAKGGKGAPFVDRELDLPPGRSTPCRFGLILLRSRGAVRETGLYHRRGTRAQCRQ
ncbi:hypothetical protein K474DRAFT_1659542 [Panus rudis PR-1116 ss-1]|nr:hypothetical protein K474DRAFT_1659542 [Panus rudis PR-1116 ss-1]